jgi:hypothetical protein
MKRSISFLLLAFTVATAQAGSFGGPPPFTNGSPLTTGVAGTYQASARGSGISGIIRFSYASTGNPSATGLNDYIFFVNGTIVTGTTEAAIMDADLMGVLGAPSAPTVPPTLGYFDALGGAFTGKFNTKSSYYSFKGKGDLQTYISEGGAPISAVTQNFKLSGMRTSQN